jgi:hypothetical protein
MSSSRVAASQDFSTPRLAPGSKSLFASFSSEKEDPLSLQAASPSGVSPT